MNQVIEHLGWKGGLSWWAVTEIVRPVESMWVRKEYVIVLQIKK